MLERTEKGKRPGRYGGSGTEEVDRGLERGNPDIEAHTCERDADPSAMSEAEAAGV